jgi:hypothetical protein
MMKLLFVLIPFTLFGQFQPLGQADWSLNRTDHQLHYFGSIALTILVSGVATYIELDEPNIRHGLLVGSIVGGGVAIGKELIWDYTLGLGTPTYPDLVYGVAGVAVGLVTTYAMYRFHKWEVNKRKEKERLKVEEAL